MQRQPGGYSFTVTYSGMVGSRNRSRSHKTLPKLARPAKRRISKIVSHIRERLPQHRGSGKGLTSSLLPWWLGYSIFVQAMAITSSLVALLFGYGFGAFCTLYILRRRA